MKRFIYLFSLAIFILGCENSEPVDTEPFSRSDKPCLVDEEGECITPGGGSSGTHKMFRYFQRGNNNASIYWGVTVNGGANWGTGQLNISAETSAGPAATYHSGNLHLFYKGDNSDKIFYSTSSSGLHWSGNQIIHNDVRTLEDVSVTSFGGKMWVGYTSSVDQRIYYITSIDGNYWTSPRTLSPELGFNPPFFLEFNGGLYAFFNGDYGNIWQVKFNPATQRFGTATMISNPFENNFIGPAKGVTAAVFDNKIYFVYRTFWNAYLRTFGYDPYGETPELKFTVPQYIDHPNSRTASRPSIASDGTRLLVVYRNEDDNMKYAESFDGQSWVTQNLVGATANSPYLIYYEYP